MKNLNLKRMLSYLKNPQAMFKAAFSVMIAILIVDVICFVKNSRNGNFGMCIFNVVLFAGIGYHSLLMLVAILKSKYQKSVLILIGIDLCSLIAHILCPIYMMVAFTEGQIDFILPVGISALLCHFFFIPILRNMLTEWEQNPSSLPATGSFFTLSFN